MIRNQTVPELIRELNAVDESEDLEAKHISGSTVGKSVYETICALSNEPDLKGGTILLGVDREQALFPFYNPVGVSAPDRLSSDIASACATMFNQPIRVDIKPVAMQDGAVVLKIDVPELSKAQKPAYLKATGLPRGAFRRVGPTDVHCTDEDMTAFYQEQANDPYDTRLARDATWDDLDPASVSAYRKARKEANPAAEELNWSDEEMLYSLGAVRTVDDRLRITNAGLLTFGKSAALRRLFPTLRVDYIRVPGNQWVPNPDSTLESLDMRGSIVTIIGRVIAAISDDLPKTLVVEDSLSGQRTETPVVPLRVIREAVVNALMHRSYQVSEPIQILRYPNRIVIQNPGYSLKSQDRFDAPGSLIRNPTVAAILHETRFAETKGSGIRVMQQKMKESGLASPTFESDRDRDGFTATFLFHHFLDKGDWSWLAQFSDLALTEDQMKALIFVREVGAIDNSTYRSLTRTDTLAASKSLRGMCTSELLLASGSGARVYYVPGPEMERRSAIVSADRGPTIHDKRAIMDGSIHDNGVGLADLPHPLRVAVRTAMLIPRLKPEQAKLLILKLCSWKALSLAEIATLIGKTPNYVSQRYIAPMVASGELAYLYPEMIQHPDQKYQATSVRSPVAGGGL